MAKLIQGVNDLATTHPKLAAEWHPDKNWPLVPQNVTAGSNKTVWWLGLCGHEWPAKVIGRVRGNGCPYCSDHKVLIGYNDLASVNPDITEEWDLEKNAPFTPHDFLSGSHKHVWWKCSKCGYEWPAEIRMRTQKGQGCPSCGKNKRLNSYHNSILERGTLADQYPELAKEWHSEKNSPKSPSDYTPNSAKSVWWICKNCGYEWPAQISNRVANKSGCPSCAGNILIPGKNDLLTKSPGIAKEWHPTKNLPKTPQSVSAYSNEKVWWTCKYGHEYRCRVYDRQKGVGCSECSKRFRTSFPESIAAYYIEKYFPGTIRNYRPDFLAGAEIDIYISELTTGIEYDGQRYHQSIERDQFKDRLCSENGIQLIRIRECKCPDYSRSDPTFILLDQKDETYSLVISSILDKLGIEFHSINVSQDKQIIMEKYRDTAINGSLSELYPSLAAEWDYEANGGLKPENIPATKSHDRYNWECSKCRHQWSAILVDRINGSGCPACAGKVIIPGFNDLATTHPYLAKEWHPMKNGDLLPSMVSKGKIKRVWWKCSRCGFEWSANIRKRVEGSGCKQCVLKEKAEKQYKAVYQFSKSGNFIKKYDSARIAAKELNINRSSIQQACNGKNKTAGGYCWSYNMEIVLPRKPD